MAFALMKIRPYLHLLANILMLVAIVGACFAFHNIVIRVMCFLIAISLGFISFCFFERIRLGDAFLKSHTGKAGFPGSVRACIACGTVALMGAIFFIYCGVRH